MRGCEENQHIILEMTGLKVRGREVTTHSLIRGGPSRPGPSSGGVPGYVRLHIQYLLRRDGCLKAHYQGL